jgi:hypothetical protein
MRDNYVAPQEEDELLEILTYLLTLSLWKKVDLVEDRSYSFLTVQPVVLWADRESQLK